jgi:uncharacterized C2H2 Zn-finger protein
MSMRGKHSTKLGIFPRGFCKGAHLYNRSPRDSDQHRWKDVEGRKAIRELVGDPLFRCNRCHTEFTAARANEIECPTTDCDCVMCGHCELESHPGLSCEENRGRALIRELQRYLMFILDDRAQLLTYYGHNRNGEIFQTCPRCERAWGVPIACYHAKW